MKVGEKQNQTSSDLCFHIKDCEISLCIFVKFLEEQMDSLLDWMIMVMEQL